VKHLDENQYVAVAEAVRDGYEAATDAACAVVAEHLAAMLEHNKTVNLTAITDWEQAVKLHVRDSMEAAALLTSLPSGSACDLGTGAGYPGIPLSAVTGRAFTLVESVGKKCRFMEAFLETQPLLSECDVFCGRAEDLGSTRAGQYTVVTARALSSLPSLVELASPLLRTHGFLLAMKADPAAEEIESGRRAAEQCGMRLLDVRRSVLSGGEQRSIFCYEKVGRPRVALPRRMGLAQKKPLA
jgi:16S rRNA (guanine527-N7)-methyltransferase